MTDLAQDPVIVGDKSYDTHMEHAFDNNDFLKEYRDDIVGKPADVRVGPPLVKNKDQSRRTASTMPATVSQEPVQTFNMDSPNIGAPILQSDKFEPAKLGTVQASQTGIPHVDAILNSPVTSHVIENPVIDRTHNVPYTAGGSVPLEDPTVYIDKRFPKQFTVNGVSFDPAEPFTVHENTEQYTMEQLIKGGMDKQIAYKVAHFEFAEKAEAAWYKSHGIDKEAAEEEYRPYMEMIQREPATNIPKNLYKDPYPHDHPSAAKDEAFAESKPTKEEVDKALEILASKHAALTQEGGEPSAGMEQRLREERFFKYLDDTYKNNKTPVLETPEQMDMFNKWHKQRHGEGVYDKVVKGLENIRSKMGGDPNVGDTINQAMMLLGPGARMTSGVPRIGPRAANENTILPPSKLEIAANRFAEIFGKDPKAAKEVFEKFRGQERLDKLDALPTTDPYMKEQEVQARRAELEPLRGGKELPFPRAMIKVDELNKLLREKEKINKLIETKNKEYEDFKKIQYELKIQKAKEKAKPDLKVVKDED